MRSRNPAIDQLAAEYGVVFDAALDFLPRHERRNERGAIQSYGDLDGPKVQLALDEMMGMDAITPNNYSQPTLVTAPNSAIPAMLTTFIDPKTIDVVLSPLKSELIYGSTKKGDWVKDTAMFAMVESTGFVAAYGDFNEAGRSDANVQWPQRQNYVYQTITEWGERELERMGLARIDWAARKNIASARTINQFANLINFYGVSGLQNYGGLNDPSLSAALTPATKIATGTSWKNALPTEILADIQAAFAQLQIQTGSNLEMDTPMTLGLHSVSEVYLANTNSFGLTALGMIKTVFPGIKIVNAPQYLSGTTYSFQLIVDEIQGQRTCESAFSEKLRAHRIIPALSSFRQKKTAGGWGTIIYYPIGIVSMAGI